MMLSNITPRERRYLEALADAYMEAPDNSDDEFELHALLQRVYARLLLGECDREQIMDEAVKRFGATRVHSPATPPTPSAYRRRVKKGGSEPVKP